MANYAKMRLAGGAKSILPELAGGMEHITARIIGEAEKRGDALAAETIDRAANGLATVFYNLYQTFGCDRLYTAGACQAGRAAYGQGPKSAFTNSFPWRRNTPMTIVPAELGDNAGIIRGGAADG